MYNSMDFMLVTAAVVPAVILLYRIYRVDKLDKEPIGLILKLIFQGIIATALASFTERLGIGILDVLFGGTGNIYNVLMYFGVVACSEEIFKYMLLYRRTWNSPEFNCQFDGVVYAVCVSLGFALWENIGYVAEYGWATAIVRAFTAVPGHASFGVFMGVYYGLARRYENLQDPANAAKNRKKAIVVPVLLHGFYDYIATLESSGSDLIFLIFIIVMFVMALRTVRKLAKNDRFIRARVEDYYPQ